MLVCVFPPPSQNKNFEKYVKSLPKIIEKSIFPLPIFPNLPHFPLSPLYLIVYLRGGRFASPSYSILNCGVVYFVLVVQICGIFLLENWQKGCILCWKNVIVTQHLLKKLFLEKCEKSLKNWRKNVINCFYSIVVCANYKKVQIIG